MRTRASIVLSAVALAQVILLGVSLAILVYRLRGVRQELVLLGEQEQSFLMRVGDAETEMYGVSILLRDTIALQGHPQHVAQTELAALLRQTPVHSIEVPPALSPQMRAQLQTIEDARRDYLARARPVAAWGEAERKALGPAYLSGHLAPARMKFVATVREITALLRSIRESRNHNMAASIEAIQTLIVRILAGAAVLGLILAGVAVRRIRFFEKERDLHVQDLRRAEEDLRALSQRLVVSQELERKKISRELHDEVGQILTAMRIQLGQIETADDASHAHYIQASELAERSLRTVRGIARGLRPAMLDDLGLGAALQWLGRDVSRNTEVEVSVQIEGELSGLDEPTRTCLYRVVQEALTNCVKHSGASSARVLLHESPAEIVLTVQDNGAGFTPSASRGIGLLGMRERVEELGGRFAVVTSAGNGTLIRVNLPKATIEGA